MTENPINGLDSKIFSLAGVERKKSSDSSHDSFYVDGREFVRYLGQGEVLLFLTDDCRQKLEQALRSEPRAVLDDQPDGWIKLLYKNEVDIEFVFLYIRYAWKFMRGMVAA